MLVESVSVEIVEVCASVRYAKYATLQHFDMGLSTAGGTTICDVGSSLEKQQTWHSSEIASQLLECSFAKKYVSSSYPCVQRHIYAEIN